MTTKSIVLTLIVIALAGFYVYMSDWFTKPTIQIIYTRRAGTVSRIPRDDNAEVYPVSFSFNKKYRVTSAKVVSASEFATNKYAHPLWHVISDSNSLPTKVLIYGTTPRGMKPEVPGAKPQPLQPNVNYLLFVEAREASGKIDFQTSEVVHSPNQ